MKRTLFIMMFLAALVFGYSEPNNATDSMKYYQRLDFNSFDNANHSITSTNVFVDSEYKGISDGTATKPYSSIQQAIKNSQEGYTVNVAPGYYFENIDYSGKNIVIKATGSVEETIIVGATYGLPKVLFKRGENEQATLDGFTISSDLGAAIKCLNSSPTIINCNITKNIGREGGGIVLDNSKAQIISCRIEANESIEGGGIYAVNSSFVIRESYMVENSADRGSVIMGKESKVTLINCLIVSNHAEEEGTITLDGGGLSMDFCTVSGNNSGIILNGSPSKGGWSVKNSIVYNNAGFDFHATSHLNITYSNTTARFQGIGNISANPLFAIHSDNIWFLSPFSPCIGAGIKTDTETDIEGNERPNPPNSEPDIGCYESPRSKPAPAELHVSTTGNNDDGDGTPENPFASINYALNATIGGERIIVAPGTYYENIQFNGKNSQVVSYYATTRVKQYIDDTIIDGSNANAPTVSFNKKENEQAGLLGFTITGGNTPNGGGIFVSGSSPTLTNLKIRGNKASTNGGGILLQNSRATLRDIVVAENVAGNFGAGIFIINSIPILERIDIHKNSASINGGLAINNSQIIGKHLTIADNQGTAATAKGAGLLSVGSTAYVVNSIIWGNIPDETATMLSGTIDIFYTDYRNGFQGEGNIDADPLFLDPVNNDYRLSPNSPCRNSGTAHFIYNDIPLINLSPASYSGTAPDMGAYDYLFAETEDNVAIVQSDLKITATPNPFNPSTTINFHLLNSSATSLTIYNVKGQKTKDLLTNNFLEAGNHSVIWDGVDNDGQKAASGVYLIKLTYGKEVQAVKIMMLK